MPTETRTRSTADVRRPALVHQALIVFAHRGYYATTVNDVAAAAGISPAYVLRLFRSKLELFVAAVDAGYARIVTALDAAAEAVRGAAPGEVLAALGQAYAELIADRTLLMIQVHAQSASDLPEVRAAAQRGLAALVGCVQQRSGATAEDVQRTLAYGQLCHLIVTADLDAVDEPWARVLTDGMTHVPAAPATSGGPA